MINRKEFIKKTTKFGVAAMFGFPMLQRSGSSFFPGLNAEENPLLKEFSNKLRILNDNPINAETPAHLLDPDLTPNDLFFIRNNGIPPENPDINSWTLTIDGEAVQKPKTYSYKELITKFKSYTYDIVIECGGNGRHEFSPPARGNQWTTGAVGCARYKGVRLKDVLNDCGVKKNAVYVAYYGADTHLSGDPDKVVISRGVPVAKALESESLIAYQMNGKELPLLHGYPLRLVIGGYPGSVCGKWLNRISIRDRVHDGPKMVGKAYRTPCQPVQPGAKVEDGDMCIIENMPVKSLITAPRSGINHEVSKKLTVRGHAWSGSNGVATVHISTDFGATWQKCSLKKAKNRFAWQRFSASISLPKKGYYEIWARATDGSGQMQPMVVPGWNPKGYLNNACHRIAVQVV